MKLGMTRSEMLSKLSSFELTEWMAFSRLEPFGVEADHLGSAITSQTIANTRLPKGRRPYKISDFMPVFRKKKQQPDAMVQIVEGLNAAMGGKDMRKK